MSLTGNLETNSIGGFGGGYGGFGGFGGGGIIEGLLLGTLLRGGRGGLFGGGEGGGDCLSADGIAAKTALLINQNTDQNALLGAIASNNATTVAEGRALAGAICESEKTNLQQFYAAAIQNANLTQSIKDQASAYAVVADKRFDDIALQSSQQTTAILARIGQSELDNLRDQLHETRRSRDSKDVEIQIQNSNVNTNSLFQAQAQAQYQRDADEHRRRADFKEIEINNINQNTNVQAQLQAQNQWQTQKDFENQQRWATLFSQQNKAGQDIVNLGTMVASGVQTPTSTNVNSKQ
jgi:hypothetical protein